MMLLETGLAQGPARAAAPRPGPSGLAGCSPAAAPVPKRFTAGTHRDEQPARTLARLVPRLADFGITRIARLTGFDRTGVEVFAAVRPNARGLSVANGKGLDPAAARVSAAMEAIERWHAERPRSCRCASASPTTSPRSAGRSTSTPCPAAARRCRRPARLGRGDRPRHRARRRWCRSTSSHTCWLALAPESPFFTSTNGLASGSHPVEAALHGLCELIEGDAVRAVRAPAARGAGRPAASTSARIDDPAVAALLDRSAAAASRWRSGTRPPTSACRRCSAR